MQRRERTLTSFVPAAVAIFDASKCNPVTPASYENMSKIDPVRRSQIWRVSLLAKFAEFSIIARGAQSTYPNTLVEAAADKMQFIKHESRDGTCVTCKRSNWRSTSH